MNLLQRALKAGDSPDMPDYLRRKVFPTNLIALILIFGVATPFAIISTFYFGFLAFYPALGGIICLGCVIVNFMGGLYYTRYVISLVPIFLGSIYNAYLSNDGEQPLLALYLLELAFTMIPFVIFDLRERKPLIYLVGFCSVLILSFPITNNWFVCDIDSTVLRFGWLSTLTVVLSITFAVGCILGLALLNNQAQQDAEKLLTVSTEKNAELEKSREQMLLQMEEIKRSSEIIQRTNWETNGISLISSITRQEYGDHLYSVITQKLVQYVGAYQAALYIRDGSQLKLMGSYAYEYTVADNYSVDIEDSGLLGQCYRDRRHQFITNVPSTYIQINSGLGAKSPLSLMVMPLMNGEEVEGMMELAFFAQLKEYEVDFLLKVAEKIGITIQTYRLEFSNSELLNRTQSQEEELRQNLEEMTAINEEAKRKMEHFEQIIEELRFQLRRA
ncbi:MAG: GAF domain-containing protein [Cytophagaceae bacterium]|jgi:hypothetical protein|nr:GAF domain-containing protein [Cytophagaceae bacterium]